MRFFKKSLYAACLVLIGWMMNFILDTQFVLGMLAGWLMKEGYDSFAKYLFNLI